MPQELPRRAFLAWLLQSSALLASSLPRLAHGHADQSDRLIASANEAVTVFDFEPTAKRALLDAHYTYLSMGVEHEVTLAANRAAFADFRLRPRRLVDVREIDTSLELLGTKLTSPILLAPIGSQAAYHSQAELGVARAAAREGHLQIVSMGASTPLAEVAEARDGALWAQIYGQRFMPATRYFLREAETAGCAAIVLTVDIVGLPTGRERIERYRRHENPACQACHTSVGSTLARGAMHVARAAGVDPLELAARSMMLDWSIAFASHVTTARDQGNPDRRGCGSLRRARSRRDRGLESRRPSGGQRVREHRCSARGRARSRWSDPGPGRQRLSTWNGRVQGAR